MSLTKIPDNYLKKIIVSGNELFFSEQNPLYDGNNILQAFESYKSYQGHVEIKKQYNKKGTHCYKKNGNYIILGGTCNLYKEFFEGHQEFEVNVIDLEEYIIDIISDKDSDLHENLDLYKDLYNFRDLYYSFVNNHRDIINRTKEIRNKYEINSEEMSRISGIDAPLLSDYRKIDRRLSPKLIPFFDEGFITLSAAVRSIAQIDNHKEQELIFQKYWYEGISSNELKKIISNKLRNKSSSNISVIGALEDYIKKRDSKSVNNNMIKNSTEIKISINDLYFSEKHPFYSGNTNVPEAFKLYKSSPKFGVEIKKEYNKRGTYFYEENGKYFLLSGTSNLYKEWFEGSQEVEGYLIDLKKYFIDIISNKDLDLYKDSDLKEYFIDMLSNKDLDLHKELSLFEDLNSLGDLRGSFVNNHRDIINRIKEIRNKYETNYREISRISGIDKVSLSCYTNIDMRLSPKLIPLFDEGFISLDTARIIIQSDNHEEQELIFQKYWYGEISSNELERIIPGKLKTDRTSSETSKLNSDFSCDTESDDTRLKEIIKELEEKNKQYKERNENLGKKIKELEENQKLKEEIKNLRKEIEHYKEEFRKDPSLQYMLTASLLEECRNGLRDRGNLDVYISRLRILFNRFEPDIETYKLSPIRPKT